MNILELIPIITEITGIQTGMLASQYQANINLDNIADVDFPVFVIYENIPSDEVFRNDDSILTTYKPFIHFLDRCELDARYIDKQAIKERLSTLIRKLVTQLRKRKEIKNTMKIIERFEIFRDIDTMYDENLVGAGFVIELPHIDMTISLCTPYTPIIPPPLFDETGLVFDFDFQQRQKMVLDPANAVISYTDRGRVLGCPYIANSPILTNNGVYFNGADNFLESDMPFVEMWIVSNSTDGVVFDNNRGLFESRNVLILLGETGVSNLYIAYGNVNMVRSNNQDTINTRVEFAPLDKFKTVSFEVINENAGTFSIGYSPDIAAFWKGNIKRILAFSTPRTEAQRTALQAYLANKYTL